MTTYYKQFVPEYNHYSLIIEDNGRVCYAYLLFKGDIVGDVWLYNQSVTPEIDDWHSNDLQAPFLNTAKYMHERIIEPFQENECITCEWVIVEDELIKVNIYLNNELIACVSSGSKPGWCILARVDGPLALKLDCD